MYDVTFGGDVYVKYYGERNMKRIVACKIDYNNGWERLDNVMIQTGAVEEGHLAWSDNTIELSFGKPLCLFELTKMTHCDQVQ